MYTFSSIRLLAVSCLLFVASFASAQLRLQFYTAYSTQSDSIRPFLALKDVTLFKPASNATPSFQSVVPVQIDGSVTLSSPFPLPLLNQWQVTKQNMQLFGVDLLDLMLIQRHIVGLQPLPTVYQQLAADVNNTRSITSSDVVELRKIMLEKVVFSTTGPWLFLDSSQVFPNPINPFVTAFPDPFTINIQNNRLAIIAVKRGDVSGNSSGYLDGKANQPIINLPITFKNKWLAQGDTVRVRFSGTTDMLGAKLRLLHPNLRVWGGSILAYDLYHQVDASHTNLILFNDFNDAYLDFQATQSGFLCDLLRLDNVDYNQCLLSNMTLSNIVFQCTQFAPPVDSRDAMNVSDVQMAIAPNPFTQAVSVSWYLPKAQKIHGTLLDVNGRVVYDWEAQADAGNYKTTLNDAHFGANGVYFVRLQGEEAQTQARIVKME